MKQKQTSKLLSVLLALCLIAGLLPWTAMPARAATSCNLWVGGTEVTSETTSGAGWAYVPDSHTLTLTDFTYSGAGHNNAAIYYNGGQNGNAPLTIELVGKNSAAHTGGGVSSCGIFVPKASLTITGSGTLTAVGGTATSYSCGIAVEGNNDVCADVSITGGTVEAKGGKVTGASINSYGIWAYKGNVSISGASTSVTAAGDEASGNSYGIYANISGSSQNCGSVSINGSAVTATGGKATGTGKSSCGIFAVQGVSITNTGDRKVTAAGGEAYNSYGIETEKADGVSIADSTVEAQGGAASDKSYGIWAYKGNVSISGASTSVTATGGAAEYSYGIYGSVSLGGGTVTASSYSATVTVAEGFTYSDGENHDLTGTLNTAGLGGKTLTPVFEAVANGSCGAKGSEDSVTWTLTKNGGKVTVDGEERDALTLAISGTGAMADFEYSNGSTTAPWYAQNDDITTVTIGNGVTTIGEYAFYDCDNLETLDLGGGVTTIGGYAFGNCSLASLDLGNVTTIGDGAFSCCYIEELDLCGVTAIGSFAFRYCTNLSELDLGSVVSIGSGAFYDCEELEGQSITIPASVTSIGGNPFGLCGLTSLSVAEGNTAYRIDENGFLLSSDGKTLLFCPAGKTGPLTVPAGVETVCDDAFNGCTGLTGPVTIPEGVETIGNGAFYGCTGLTGSVTIPDSVTSIGENAFYRCANIESIAVGSGIKAIGLYAFNNCSALKDIRIEGDSTDSTIVFYGGLFSGCYSLETVTLGDSVREIGGGAFMGCSSIKSIFVSRNTEITGGAFSGINNGKVYYYGGNTTYNISSWSMNPDNAKPYRILTVADSVANGTVTASGTTTPEDLAAKNCFLPGDTVTLTLTPDDGCSVDSVSYNDGSDHTLTPADGVCSFTMPGDADVTVSAVFTANANPEAAIGDTEYATLQAAFAAASDGDTVTLLRDVEQKETLNLNDAASLSLDLNGRKLLFNSGTEENFRYFKYDDTHMATITGSGTIEAIGSNGNATIPLWRFCRDGDADTGTGTLTILVDAAMKNIKNTGDRPWAAFTNSITEAALEEGVTKIGVVTFCACENLKTITIPSTVTSINEDSSGLLPFDRCPKLEKIIVADDNETYTNNKIDGVSDGVLYTKDKTTLIFCPRGKTGTLTVPAEVTTLKEYSFNNDDDTYNSTMRLSRIEFARTEPGTLSTDKAFDSYTGKCVLVASDGMLIDNQRQAPATDYTTGTTISFRAVTRWDELQEALNKGGTVTLTRSYDYTKDSYEINGWGIISYYGKLNVPKGTVLDLNGYTLAAVEFCGDGEFTVKGGTLNCMRLTNNATMVDPANATYGTLTLDDATVTADQLLWFGGMALMESTLTVGESEEGAGNNGKNINVTWVQPESGAMLTMDTASSVTLPQQKETDGQWRLADFQTSEDVAAAAGQLGTYLPRGWTFETITGTRNYGSSEQPYYVPYYALAVKDAAGAYPTSVTLRNYFSVQDGKVTAPEGAVLIVAEYDTHGKMTSAHSVSAPADGWVGVPIADIASGAGFTLPDTYKLFLVNGETYAPLCAAWSN